MTKFEMPEFIDSNIRYIICPDIECNGFYKEHLQCGITNWLTPTFSELPAGMQGCPKVELAKSVVFCKQCKKFIESPVTVNKYARIDCECGYVNFTNMSNTTIRIPLSKYDEFLKLEVR